MRTRIVKHHYCDHCNKVKHTIPAMVRHERGCTANPDRKCRMCEIGGFEQKPMAELLATLVGSTWGISDTGEQTAEVQKEKELREAANNCPACILATLRQNKLPEVSITFDFKAESKAWMNEYFTPRWEGVGL